jgi:hypothetical protein
MSHTTAATPLRVSLCSRPADSPEEQEQLAALERFRKVYTPEMRTNIHKDMAADWTLPDRVAKMKADYERPKGPSEVRKGPTAGRDAPMSIEVDEN